MKILGIILILVLISGCAYFLNKKKSNQSVIMENKNPDPTPTPQEKGQKQEYVVSEAAVGNIGGVPFTLSGISKNEAGKDKVTLDINKSRFVDAVVGDEIKMDENTTVRVTKIERADPPQRGQISFVVVE